MQKQIKLKTKGGEKIYAPTLKNLVKACFRGSEHEGFLVFQSFDKDEMRQVSALLNIIHYKYYYLYANANNPRQKVELVRSVVRTLAAFKNFTLK